MGELEQKRESEVEQERAQKQQQDAQELATKADKKSDKKEVEVDSNASLIRWDADVEHLMERMSLYVRDLRVSMGSTEFRSLVNSYRELSPMGRRAVANRMQRNKLDALLRAIHAGDYRMYQETWHADAEALERAEAQVKPDPAGDTIKNGD